MARLCQFPIERKPKGSGWKLNPELVISRQGLAAGISHTFACKQQRHISWLVNNTSEYGLCVPVFCHLDDYNISLHVIRLIHIVHVQ